MRVAYECWVVAGVFGLQTGAENCASVKKMMHAP